MRAIDRIAAVRGRLALDQPVVRGRLPGEQPPLVCLASAVVLAGALALAAAIAVFALVTRALGHSETLEAVWWLAALGAVAPLTVIGAAYLLRAGAPEARQRLPADAALALVVLSAALAAARAADALPLSLLAVLALPLVLAVARRERVRALAARAPVGGAGAMAVVFAVAGPLGVALFLPRSSHDPVVLALMVALLSMTGAICLPLLNYAPSRRVRIALALLTPLVLALLAWDVSFQVLSDHQNFYLGPVNDIDHGRYMLVDDYSQYGVGVIYFLAAVLAPLPFGYGSFVLVLGLLTAAMFTTIYVVLRIATQSTVFAGLGTFAALTASAFATEGRTVQYPSTGFLRFGLPWLVVCALVIAYRRDRPSRPALLTAAALVGIASVWSFETAFYSAFTFAVTTIAVASTRPAGWRLRQACAQLGIAAAAVAIAVGTLIAATVIGRGAAPRPGGYLDLLRLYSVKGFGTLPVPGWSLGYLICALYAISLGGTAAIMRHARGSALARPSTIVPLIAVTSFGASAFTYFLGRSHPNNLTHIAPPFVAMLVLWAALAWRAWGQARHPVAAVALALGALAGALLVAEQVTPLIVKGDDSALAALVRSATGGRTLPHELRGLTREPVVYPGSLVIERMVRNEVPRSAPLLIAAEPALGTEVKIRLQRIDVLPIGAAEQDMLVPKRRALLIREARGVPCGTYVVTQTTPLFGNARPLFGGILGVLRRRHAFVQVAAAPGFRLFRLGCRS